ncbi:hypothetical protein SCLCIDRAFT_1042932 [Scleroderma citrinum Foug A]|uniref:Uncharacterized protein n=1 Tax=Scleroderma citrinum Foug A TaxID=1036808 RepID=A0A0C2ZB05_9AGAM|nr:hypothetical protein SCLCIDRAFT_1042932 [Scleroderma citrinum Foug A]
MWRWHGVDSVVVFVLTLWRSYYLRTPGRRTVANIFLRDGSMYFGMLTAANGVNIIVLLVSNSDCFKGSTGGLEPPLKLNYFRSEAALH